MDYVDGFVAAVKTENREVYRAFAQNAAALFRRHGATRVVECWGDDVPDGKLTSFALAVKKRDDETVVFSWITWKSKEARDAGMKKVFADMEKEDAEMPFDGKRMIYGGFETIVDV